jgi:anti-sigma factor RsiW
VTHLGQRLSALIDGELDPSERDRVLIHITRCGACRDEVAALRMLKRRMNALGEGAASAALTGLAGLTGRLMELSELGLGQAPPGGAGSQAGWNPASAANSGWTSPDPDERWRFPAQDSRSEHRTGRYFLAGSLAIFMAGLGTAAFLAGGEAQPSAPAPPVVPSVDVMVVPHEVMNGPLPTLPEPSQAVRGLSVPGLSPHR